MIIPALNAQNVYGSGKGEAYKLKTPDVSKPAEQIVRVAEATAKVEGAIDQEVDIDSWQANYYDFANEVDQLKSEWAERRARGEVNDLQMGAGYARDLQRVTERARLTKQQEGYWKGVKEIYDKDDKGLYDTTIGNTKLQVYEDPRKFVNLQGYEDIKVQLDSVGGDVVKWRAKFGAYYLQPELAYDDAAATKKFFGDIKPVTTDEITTDPLVQDGIVTRKVTATNIPDIISTGRQLEQLALQGDFQAKRYLQTAQGYIGRQMRFSESGGFSPTQAGRELLQTMSEIYTLNPDAGTIDFNDGAGPVPIDETTLERGLMDAYNVQKARKFQEQKEDVNVQLRASTRNNINVNTGGTDPKASLGYYTTQKEAFAGFVQGEYNNILQEFSTPELRNTPSFTNALYGALGKSLDIDEVDPAADGYWAAKINTKMPVQEANRPESVGDLSIQTKGMGGSRQPIKDLTGEVSNLKPVKQTFVLTYYNDADQTWRIATDDDIRTGRVSMNNVRLGVRQAYEVSKPKTKKTGAYNQNEEVLSPVEAELYKRTNNGKDQVVRIYPFERGGAERLDALIGGADKYAQYRSQGAGSIPGKVPSPKLQTTVNTAFE